MRVLLLLAISVPLAGQTRIYFPSTGAAAVTPSSWIMANQIASPVTLAGVTTRINSSPSSLQGNHSTTNPSFTAGGRWVIGPLSAQTISGTVKGQFRASEGNGAANATLAIAIKIIQPGGADRATLLSPTASDDTSATPPELSSFGLINRRMQDSAESTSISLTSQSATSGDYLVIEVGVRSASSSGYVITWRTGDNNATDLPENNTTNADNNPWIEFSNTISFGGSTNYERTPSSSFTISPGLTATVGRARALSDSFTLSPSTGIAAGRAVVVSDTIEATSDFGRASEFARAVSSTVDATATLQPEGAFARAVADAVEVAGGLGRIAGFSLGVSDGFDMASDVGRAADFPRAPESTFSLSGSLTAEAPSGKDLSDSVTLSSELLVIAGRSIAVSDTFVFSAGVDVATGGTTDYSVSIADGITLSSALVLWRPRLTLRIAERGDIPYFPADRQWIYVPGLRLWLYNLGEQ